MTRHFCTLFDRNYVFKAASCTARSLRHCPSFRLTAFCFDDEAQRVIDALELPNVSTVSLAELEDVRCGASLRQVGPQRRSSTCGRRRRACRSTCSDRPELDEVTYLDADLMFFSDPEPIFEELGDASVLITPHRFSPELAHHAINGIYNVQFLTFRRDERGLEALNWWHDRCIEWCYYRLRGR